MDDWLHQEERYYLTQNGTGYRVAYLKDQNAALKHPGFIKDLVTCYRDIFGHGAPVDPASWSEYLFCPECHRRYSISDVFDLTDYAPLAELDEPRLGIRHCSSASCKGRLEPCYSSEKLTARLTNAMTAYPFFCSVILGQEMRVSGLHYGWVAPLKDLWPDFAYLYDGTKASEAMFLHSAQSRSSGRFSPDTKVLYMTELGVSLPARDKKLLQGLVRAFFRSMPEDILALPSVAVSEPDKRGYALLDAAGHSPLFSISGRPTTVMGGKARETAALWNLPAATFKAACAPAIARSRQYGQAIPA